MAALPLLLAMPVASRSSIIVGSHAADFAVTLFFIEIDGVFSAAAAVVAVKRDTQNTDSCLVWANCDTQFHRLGLRRR